MLGGNGCEKEAFGINSHTLQCLILTRAADAVELCVFLTAKIAF